MPSEVWVRINSDQLAYFSLLQLAELLADGRLSPQQLAGVFTSRLRRCGGQGGLVGMGCWCGRAFLGNLR